MLYYQNYGAMFTSCLGETTSGTMAVLDLDGDGYTEIISSGYTAGMVYVHTYAPLQINEK